jgi:FMN reductase
MRLVVVSAGLTQPSSTRLLADRLSAAVEAHADVDVRVVELRDLAVDIANHLVTGFPSPALGDALRAVGEADGLVAATPVFTASYSGLFKSFFDLLATGMFAPRAALGDALTGKPVLIAATGGTARHSLALEHALRPLFAYLHAVVVPTAVYAAPEDWASGDLATRINRAAGELAGLMLRTPAVHAGPEPELVPFAEHLAALRKKP